MLAAAELVIAQGIQEGVHPCVGPLISAADSRADAAGVRVVSTHTTLEDLREHAGRRPAPAFAVFHRLVVLVGFVLESFLHGLGQVRQATLNNQARTEGVALGGRFIAQLGARFVDCQQASTDEQVLALCDEQTVFGVDGWLGSRCHFRRFPGRLAGWQHGLVNLAEALDVQCLDWV